MGTPTPRSIYRKDNGGAWALITPTPDFVSNDNIRYLSFKEGGLQAGHQYYYEIRDLYYNDEGQEPWDGGIGVVTRVPTATPKSTPTALNLLENPKFSLRYLQIADKDANPTPTPYPMDLSSHWTQFVWPQGCGLPPSGSSTGLGANQSNIDWRLNPTDVPSGGGCWSQEFEGTADFCAGIYQQVRVTPGFDYRVYARGKIVGGNNNSMIAIGVAEDGSIDPSRAEWTEWDEKTSANDTGNWGKKQYVGSDWLSRSSFGSLDITAVADTITIFLIGQSSSGQSTSFIFNDVSLELDTMLSTPTPAPRRVLPVLTVTTGGPPPTPLMAVSCRGDVVANSKSEGEANIPGDIASMPWKAYSGNEGAWVDTSGVLHMTGVLTDCRPTTMLNALRGGGGPLTGQGPYVFGVDSSNGNVFCRGEFYVRTSDSDNDTLSNWDEVETYGTDPGVWDTDADRVSDYTELFGASVSNTPLALPTWGANPLHKDLWIELDWMNTPTPAPPPATPVPPPAPDPTALSRVVIMFNKAPIENPDGLRGITLHIDAGPTKSVNYNGSTTFYLGGENVPFQWVSPLGLVSSSVGSSAYRTITGAPVFRYAVMAYRHADVDKPGDGKFIGGSAVNPYFIITQWRFPTDEKGQASAIAHEFGHCLGQNHGGDQSGNGYLGKLNYNSVMNYAYTGGIDTDHDAFGLNYDLLGPRDWPYPDDVDETFTLDYSVGDRLDLRENELDERIGVCGCEYPVDWDEDGMIDSTPSQRNMDKRPTTFDLLTDYNNWRNIKYHYGVGFGPGPSGPRDTEPTPTPVACSFQSFE